MFVKYRPEEVALRSRFWLVVVLTVVIGVAATTTACGFNFSASSPFCQQYVPPTQPIPAPSPDEVGKPKTITPTGICDDWITIRDTKAECAFLNKSYELDGAGQDLNGESIEIIVKLGEYVRINWATSVPHAIIVNKDTWGYVNGPGTEGEGHPAPSATILRYSDWGSDLFPLMVCDNL